MSGSSPARTNATYDALRALPDDVRAELLAGTIEISPSPTPEHGRAQRTLGHLIGGPFDDDDDRGGHGGWWIIPEVDIRLSPHDVVRPDLAGWRRERLPNPWGKLPIEVVPDWICEIVSARNAAHDRGRARGWPAVSTAGGPAGLIPDRPRTPYCAVTTRAASAW
jgi:Uma2 family endonuclease